MMRDDIGSHNPVAIVFVRSGWQIISVLRLEYLVDEDGGELYFSTHAEAVQYLETL